MTEFGTLNWSILVIYVIANLGLGFYLGKRSSRRTTSFLEIEVFPGGQLVFQ
jgi:solute:Na+ symporter, SSS family